MTMGNPDPTSLSHTMLRALEAASCAAGLWRHRDRPGYYVPGLGSVPFNRRTIQALVSRGLVEVTPMPTDHEVVYADAVVQRGAITVRVQPTPHGARLAAELAGPEVAG